MYILLWEETPFNKVYPKMQTLIPQKVWKFLFISTMYIILTKMMDVKHFIKQGTN